MRIKDLFISKKVSSTEVVSKKQSRAAKRVVIRAIKESIHDQRLMIKRAKQLKNT